ncbi:hypothetical protein AtNW77_Chr4g0294091 [Arabidopsis thaliana]
MLTIDLSYLLTLDLKFLKLLNGGSKRTLFPQCLLTLNQKSTKIQEAKLLEYTFL